METKIPPCNDITSTYDLDIEKRAADLLAQKPHKIEDCPKRIRILKDAKWIVDTLRAKYVWEHSYYPVYYIPREEFSFDLDDFFYVQATYDFLRHGAIHFKTGPLDGLIRYEFKAMDAWFEEDEQIYVHPKDPYKRVDIRTSTRHIKVEIAGHIVAETPSATLLFETGLPTRYYLPPTCFNLETLIPSQTVTSCPYKGDASYYNVKLGGQIYRDIIWWYKSPIQESIAIAGMMCFYNEKVDIWVDGVMQERPKTKFSSGKLPS